MFLVMFGAAGTGFRVIPDQKISKKNFGTKKCFIRSEKAIGPARAEKKKSKKFEIFWLDELPARPDRTGTSPARPRFRNFRFHGSGNLST